MGWALWRQEKPEASDTALEAHERDAASPGGELRIRTRRRLIGAAALLLASVFVVPMVLDPAPRPVPDVITMTTPIQAEPIKSAVEPAPVVPIHPAPAATATAEPAQPDSPPKTAKLATEPISVVPVPAVPAPDEKFALQVAALSTAAAANQLVVRLKKAGFVAYVEPVRTAEGPRHRVRIGPFSGRDDAQRVGEKLRKAGFAAALVGA